MKKFNINMKNNKFINYKIENKKQLIYYLKNIKLTWIFKTIISTIGFGIIISMIYYNRKEFYPAVIIFILSFLLIYLFERDIQKKSKAEIEFFKNKNISLLEKNKLNEYNKFMIFIQFALIINFILSLIFLILFIFISINYKVINFNINYNAVSIMIAIYIVAKIILMTYVILQCNKISK